jgi:maltooligosyltrehalose trehalohydrolase
MYFVSHSDPDLIQAVRAGRKEEFKPFHYAEDPPDPESAETFLKCKLNWELRHQGQHQELWNWYRQLIALRKTHPALLNFDRDSIAATSDEEKKVVVVRRWCESSQVILAMSFNSVAVGVGLPIQQEARKLLDSGCEAAEVLSAGEEVVLQPLSLVLYEV